MLLVTPLSHNNCVSIHLFLYVFIKPEGNMRNQKKVLLGSDVCGCMCVNVSAKLFFL